MSSISFEYSGEMLILCYTPAMGIGDITKKLSKGDCFPIKHTFSVTKALLYENTNEQDDWEAYNGISKETFENLISKFPKTAELNKYAHMRIASIIKDYFPECDKYEAIYEKFIDSRENKYALPTPTLSKYNIQIELEQFTVAYQELRDMLNRYEAIGEKQWQEKNHNILQLLYPKYICCVREVKFYDGSKNDKQPDFLLVDDNGFVDILEIKKADVRVLTQYRNNYVAARELSGAIQQIEKYLFCLNSSDKAKEDVLRKMTELLPSGIRVQIVNPQGILLMGRSNVSAQ